MKPHADNGDIRASCPPDRHPDEKTIADWTCLGQEQVRRREEWAERNRRFHAAPFYEAALQRIVSESERTSTGMHLAVIAGVALTAMGASVPGDEAFKRSESGLSQAADDVESSLPPDDNECEIVAAEELKPGRMIALDADGKARHA